MADIWISVAIGLFALGSGVLGIVMALYPPETQSGKVKFIAGFTLLGIIGLAFATWQGVRAVNAHDREQTLAVGDEKIPPLVDVLVLPDHWIVVVSNEAGASAYAVDIDISEVAPHPFDKPLTFSRPELNSSMAPIVATAIPPSGGDVCKFAAVIRTRVGTYSEQILLRKLPSGDWSRALRVMKRFWNRHASRESRLP